VLKCQLEGLPALAGIRGGEKRISPHINATDLPARCPAFWMPRFLILATGRSLQPSGSGTIGALTIHAAHRQFSDLIKNLVTTLPCAWNNSARAAEQRWQEQGFRESD
jgi:hypothetical protein